MFIPLLLSSSCEWLNRINENANRTAISGGSLYGFESEPFGTIAGCRSSSLDTADETASLF
jgi:hypothetical protein